jgi:hypothetical protein
LSMGSNGAVEDPIVECYSISIGVEKSMQYHKKGLSQHSNVMLVEHQTCRRRGDG